MKPFKHLHKITMSLTIALAAIVVISFSAFAAEEIQDSMVRDLSALFPNAPRPLVHETIHFLNHNRLLVVTDRLTIVDLETMEKVAEISNPVPNDESFDFSVMDRVYQLQSGFSYITERSDNGNLLQYYFQFDDELNVVREFMMSDKKPEVPESFVPDYATMDVSPDGKDIYYFGFAMTSGLYRLNLDTDEHTLLYATTHDASLNTLLEIWLINDGKTILFEQSDWVGGPNFESERRLGTIAADGTNLVLKEPNFIEEIRSSTHRVSAPERQPDTSPIFLFVPEDPQTETIDAYIALPPKTVYAWNVLTDEVTPIPLQRSHEDQSAVLSESGRFVATAAYEAESDTGGKVVFRVYDTMTGAIANQFELLNQSESPFLKVAISEKERMIRGILENMQGVQVVEIPLP